jgi:hypothetical protein
MFNSCSEEKMTDKAYNLLSNKVCICKEMMDKFDQLIQF